MLVLAHRTLELFISWRCLMSILFNDLFLLYLTRSIEDRMIKVSFEPFLSWLQAKRFDLLIKLYNTRRPYLLFSIWLLLILGMATAEIKIFGNFIHLELTLGDSLYLIAILI